MQLKAILSASMLVAIGMVAGRVLGMLREILMAAHFGIGHTGDMAITLMIIPDFITSALIGTAASAALVPAFAARTPERALALLWQSLAVSVGIFSLLVLALASQQQGLAQQLSGEETGSALIIALASIPFSVATAVITAYLQHRGRFLVPAFATFIFNSFILLALWLGADNLNLLAIGIFVAALMRLLPHIIAFWRSETTARFRFAPWELNRKLLRIYAASTGSGIFGLLPIYAPYALIAAFGSSIASFNYAFKLVLLPGLLLQTIVQLVILPWLVEQRRTATPEMLQRTHSLLLQICWLLSFCMGFSLCLGSNAIATVFFGYGKMTADAIAQIGILFAVGIWATPGMLLTTLWQVMFYSAEKPAPPLIASIAQAVLIVPLGWLGHQVAGTAGVLCAFALLQAVGAVILTGYGYRAGFVTSLIPNRTYGAMTAAALAILFPVALIFALTQPTGWWGFAFAALCGIVSLAAGAAASPAARHYLKTRALP